MCHAQLDPKLLMQDAEQRYRAAQPVASAASTGDGQTIPPELMGGFKGILARLNARFVASVRRAGAVAAE